MVSKIILGIILLTVTVTGAIAFLLPPRLPIINGYAAKKMCACTFIADRTQKSIQKNDLAFSLLQFSKTKIDRVAKTATSRFFGMGAETAHYLGDAGCVLIKDENNFDTEISINTLETHSCRYGSSDSHHRTDSQPKLSLILSYPHP